MTKWYIFELATFAAAFISLILGFYTYEWFWASGLFFGGMTIAFALIENEAEKDEKLRIKRIIKEETETEREFRELGYDFMLR